MKTDKNTKKSYLSAMETEIVKLICKGLQNKEMAISLGRTKRTIEGIRKGIMVKTGTKNTASIVI